MKYYNPDNYGDKYPLENVIQYGYRVAKVLGYEKVKSSKHCKMVLQI